MYAIRSYYGEFMKKSFGCCRTIVLRKDPGDDHPEHISDNRNRNGGKNHDESFDIRSLRKKRVGYGQGQKRHERAQPATGIGYLQNRLGENNNIPLTHYGNANHS